MDNVTVTYLGTAGWQIRTGKSAILIDPYFTRLSLMEMLFRRRGSDPEAVRRYCPQANAIFISHGHYDHIQDVPEVATLTGAPVYASRQSRELLGISGLREEGVMEIANGDTIDLSSSMRVEVHEVLHRRILGIQPARGPLVKELQPPFNARRGYRMDVLFSFRLIINGWRILILNGIDQEPDGEADILIVGMDALGKRLGRILSSARPKVIFPNHWDDMFLHLEEELQPQRLPGFPLWRQSPARFHSRCKALLPGARVIIPERFTPYHFSEERLDV